MTPERPTIRPRRPQFSSGPCAKRPGWTPAALAGACVGRSHRSPAGKAKLAEAIELSHAVLGLPADYRLGVVNRAEIQELVVTDTIPLPPHKRHEKITVLSVAPMLGEAITRIHTGNSVGELFQ